MGSIASILVKDVLGAFKSDSTGKPNTREVRAEELKDCDTTFEAGFRMITPEQLKDCYKYKIYQSSFSGCRTISDEPGKIILTSNRRKDSKKNVSNKSNLDKSNNDLESVASDKDNYDKNMLNNNIGRNINISFDDWNKINQNLNFNILLENRNNYKFNDIVEFYAFLLYLNHYYYNNYDVFDCHDENQQFLKEQQLLKELFLNNSNLISFIDIWHLIDLYDEYYEEVVGLHCIIILCIVAELNYKEFFERVYKVDTWDDELQEYWFGVYANTHNIDLNEVIQEYNNYLEKIKKLSRKKG